MADITIKVEVQGLDSLTEAIVALAGSNNRTSEPTEVKEKEAKKKSKAKSTKPKSEATTTKAKKKKTATKAKSEQVEKTFSYEDDVKKPALALVNNFGAEEMLAILEDFGVSKVREVPEERWHELHNAITSRIAELEAEAEAESEEDEDEEDDLLD